MTGPEGAIIFRSGEDLSHGRLPRIYPASIRFGTWQVQAWNAAERRVRWNVPFLSIGLLLSGLVLAGSVATGLSLRRATRQARQRVSFVNRASHDLRTPITNMMLNIDLAREIVEEDPRQANECLDRVAGEASRLSRLVDNLLTFSRSENRTDYLREVRLNPEEILTEVLLQFEVSFRDREIEVFRSGFVEAEVEADPDALAQIFGNLLSNAEKYGGSGNRLDIRTQLSHDIWSAEFEDQGPGVPSKQAERIFEPFHRARDEVCEGVSGTGLGLTIARDLGRRMGGDLRLVPSERGAIFRFKIGVSKE